LDLTLYHLKGFRTTMYVSSSHPSRTQRRSHTKRSQRMQSFSRSWQRRLSAALLVGFLPLGLSHPAQAQTLNTWNGSNGDWNTAANWLLGIPNGSGNVYYAVVNPAGNGDDLTHSSSTGPGGVDTIFSFLNLGLFNLTGGILAGSQANDGSTFINNGTTNINGGTLRNFTVSGNALNFSGSSGNMLDSDIFQNNINLSGGVARILNSLTIQSGSSANISGNGVLSAANSATLTGTVDFTDGNGGNLLGTEGGDTLTLAAGSLVHGITGQIGGIAFINGAGTVINHGTISSDGGGNIVLNAAAGNTSDGTLQAISNSTLRFDTAVNSTGGTINVQDTSDVLDNGTSLTGGTVTGSGHMTFTGNGANLLSGVTFNGATLDMSGGGFAGFTGGLTLTGGSVAKVGSNAQLVAASSNTLTGTVLFTDGNGSNILGITNGDTLTLAAGSLVHGIVGQVGAGGTGILVNHGTISSDGGGTITLNPGGGTTNDGGTLQAKESGTTPSTLLLNDNVTSINGGTLNAQDTSAIQNNGVNVTGGTVTGTGRMTFSAGSNDLLTGVTFSGPTLDLTNGNDARFSDGLTLTNGSVADIASNGVLSASATTTLSGTVDFTDGNGSNILATEGGDTLTLAAGSLVHGIAGQVGVAEFVGGSGTVVNNGTISSDGGNTITLDAAAGLTNDGVLQAKNNSTLLLDNNVTDGAGATLNVQGSSTIQNNGVNVTGGTVTGAGRMTFSAGSNDLLTGVTFSGPTLDLTNGNDARFSDGLTLTNGSVADIAGNGILSASATTTLSGTVDFTDGNGSNILSIENGGTLTLAAGSLVHGIAGQVGVAEFVGGSGTVVNNGTIKSDGGGTLTLNPGTMNNGATGTVQANGGTVTVSPTLNNAGTVLVNTGNTITTNAGETQTGGVTQVDGTFTANSAPITLNGGILEGTGTINGNTPNVVNTSGTVKPGDSPGTLTITGSYSQASTGHMLIEFTNTAHGLLTVTGGVTLGGVLDISYLGPPKANGSYQINPGDPGTTFDFLTYGTLSNTNLGTLFSNEYTGSGSFFVNGITADNFNGSPAVYQLTQDGSNALQLTLTTTATPEPSQWAAFGLGILGLTGLGLRARRRTVPAV
jgi:fibronectin-binding autotransporter adhesin